MSTLKVTEIKAFVPGETVIPPSGKLLGEEELQNMVAASLDGWLTTGRFNAEFEKKLAAFLGVKYCLSVNSGSSANLVAFSTLTSPKLGDRAIKKGDEVIGVAAGFPTTVNPIIQFGAIPERAGHTYPRFVSRSADCPRRHHLGEYGHQGKEPDRDAALRDH